MKTLKNMDCIELTLLESQQINGGFSGFWEDMAYVASITVQGLIVFGREGGRNAGISVR